MLVMLFFMWGFITVLVDSLVPRLKEIFELNYSQVVLVQVAFFLAYGLVSIPAGFLLARIGYKRGMVIGLLTMGVGCFLFYPAAGYRSFLVFMAGYFILAAGMTVLQVAANPYVAVLGPESSASSRLNLSQAFNSLGTTLAPILGASVILSDSIRSSSEIASLSEPEKLSYYAKEAAAVQQPFFWLAMSLLGLALIVLITKLPNLISTTARSGYAKAITESNLMLGVLGIFLYVGAEVTIGSFLVNYFMDMNLAEQVLNSSVMTGISSTILLSVGTDLESIDQKGVLGAFVTLYWGGAMLGRFIGSGLTRIVRPAVVLSVFAVGAISMVLLSISTVGLVSMWSIILVGLFNSVMFPTIFTESLKGLNEIKPQASGLLCTAIAGGALIPLLFGITVDQFGFKKAFFVVLICYSYVLWFGFRSVRISSNR